MCRNVWALASVMPGSASLFGLVLSHITNVELTLKIQRSILKKRQEQSNYPRLVPKVAPIVLLA